MKTALLPSCGLPGLRGRRSHPSRQIRQQAGFTLAEVLVAFVIVATTLAALQLVSNGALKTAAETNRVRIAKMLLRQKAEEFVAGTETGTGGTFDGYPNYTWEVQDQQLPVTQGDQPENVRAIRVVVTYPTLRSLPDGAALSSSDPDGPGRMSIMTYLDPVDAVLQPPGQAGGGGNPGGNNPPGGGS